MNISITCKKVNHIWKEITKLLYVKFQTKIILTNKDILLFYENKEKRVEKFVNMVTSIVKLSISQYKYGNHCNLIQVINSNLMLRKIDFQIT